MEFKREAFCLSAGLICYMYNSVNFIEFLPCNDFISNLKWIIFPQALMGQTITWTRIKQYHSRLFRVILDRTNSGVPKTWFTLPDYDMYIMHLPGKYIYILGKLLYSEKKVKVISYWRYNSCMIENTNVKNMFILMSEWLCMIFWTTLYIYCASYGINKSRILNV